MEHTHLVKGLDFALLQKVGADAAVLPLPAGVGGWAEGCSRCSQLRPSGGQYFFCW